MARVIEAKNDDAVRQPPPLRLSRVLHARRETVFKAWSTADHVTRWFSPETFTVSDAKVEMHVGGPFELCMRSPARSSAKETTVCGSLTIRRWAAIWPRLRSRMPTIPRRIGASGCS